LKDLKQACNEVFVAGFSMGGLIGIHLASRHNIAGLITINSPIYYLDSRKILSNIVHDLTTRNYNNIRRYLKPSNRLPLKTLWNFQRLLNYSKLLIPAVKTPLLVMQALDDDVVHNKSADYIYRHSPVAAKELIAYERGGHVI